MDSDRTTNSLLLPCGGVFCLQAPLAVDDLPLEMLALILGSALDPRWGFCARAVCRTWASVCCARVHWVARVSCAASLLGAASDDDPTMGTPQAAEAWCRSMGASPAWAGAALVASGRRKLVEYAINRPRAHDVASATTVPFEPLTAAVVRLCELDDITTYLDAHPLAVIPDWAVETSEDMADDDDDDPCGRERRRDVLLTLRERYALRFKSVRDRGDAARLDHLCGRARWAHAIARFMANDPKLARNMLCDCGRHQGRITADEAIFLLARTGQLNSRYWARRFETMIIDALDDGAMIDPRTVVDLLARSEPALRDRPFETPLLVRLYGESPLLASLRPVRVLDVDNCPLLDPDAQVDIGVDIALLQLASSTSSPPDIAMAHGTIDTVVSRALTNLHQCMCHSHTTPSSARLHDLWTLALRARSAHKAADAADYRADARSRSFSCAAARDGGRCVIADEARRRIAESGFVGDAWRALFGIGVADTQNS
ncbi:F-box domain containing protein [Pandoravirus dulcis]|uniref:F-box domain containing protein n=1 Tax=Pandoravirus dulcis TaxID=1349409 RepID=S4VYZ1_9VIRU|nr:F-box domain containing protein [Pandoravirus dulcis]AGO83079.1 F-box domain containing protein [Pandoravirus dulcis]